MTQILPKSQLAPGFFVRRNGNNRAVFAKYDMPAGRLVAIFGGIILRLDRLQRLDPNLRKLTLQIGPDAFLCSLLESEADWINHSCEPNCGLQDAVTLVSMRNILKGEEITFDYAMADSIPYDNFVCQCGAPTCRGAPLQINRERLLQRYPEHVSPYLKNHVSTQSFHESNDRLSR